MRALMLIAPLTLTACASVPATPPLPRVAMETEAGTIVIALEDRRAPITATNFLTRVDRGDYAGGSIYRTVRLDNDNGSPKIEVIQGGRGMNAPESAPIAHEDTCTTGLSHQDGTISMARGAPGTAGSEFFIVINRQPALDCGGMRNRDGRGFAAFGRVVKGMDVVRRIQAMKSDTPSPDAYAKGQFLNPPVIILSLRRVR